MEYLHPLRLQTRRSLLFDEFGNLNSSAYLLGWGYVNYIANRSSCSTPITDDLELFGGYISCPRCIVQWMQIVTYSRIGFSPDAVRNIYAIFGLQNAAVQRIKFTNGSGRHLGLTYTRKPGISTTDGDWDEPEWSCTAVVLWSYSRILFLHKIVVPCRTGYSSRLNHFSGAPARLRAVLAWTTGHSLMRINFQRDPAPVSSFPMPYDVGGSRWNR